MVETLHTICTSKKSCSDDSLNIFHMSLLLYRTVSLVRNYKSTSVFFAAELSSTLMEKMQAQEMISGLRIPEMDDISQFFLSLPTSTLVGIGALTAVLTYWLATRPRPIKPPCSLQHQSEEVPVNCSSISLLYCLLLPLLEQNFRAAISYAQRICGPLHKHSHTCKT